MRKPLLVILLALLLVSACTGNNAISPYPQEDYLSLVSSTDSEDEFFGPRAFKIDDHQVVIGLYGSSTCTPRPTGFSVKESRIDVSLKKHTGACTADYGGPFPYLLDLKTQAPTGEEWTLTLDGHEESAMPVEDSR